MSKTTKRKRGNKTFSVSMDPDKFDQLYIWLESDQKVIRPPLNKKQCSYGDTLFYLAKQGHSLLVERIEEDLAYKKKRLEKVKGETIE